MRADSRAPRQGALQAARDHTLMPMTEMDADFETQHVRDFPHGHGPQGRVREKLGALFYNEILAAPIRKRLDSVEECCLTQFVRFANQEPSVGTHNRLLGCAKHRRIFSAGVSKNGRGHGRMVEFSERR